jgi:hypothetical protein
MLEMRSKGYVEAADYLDRIEDCMWTLHQWSAKGAVTYGQKTSNPSEIINSALLPERDMPPLSMLCSLILRATSNLYHASENACKMMLQHKESIHAMTKWATDRCKSRQESSTGYSVTGVSPDSVLVAKSAQHSSPSDVMVYFPIHEQEHAHEAQSQPSSNFGSCTCLVPQTELLPCEHAFAADRELFLRMQNGSTSSVAEAKDLLELNMEWVGTEHLVSTYFTSTDGLSITPAVISNLSPEACYVFKQKLSKTAKGPAPRKRFTKWMKRGFQGKANSKLCWPIDSGGDRGGGRGGGGGRSRGVGTGGGGGQGGDGSTDRVSAIDSVGGGGGGVGDEGAGNDGGGGGGGGGDVCVGGRGRGRGGGGGGGRGGALLNLDSSAGLHFLQAKIGRFKSPNEYSCWTQSTASTAFAQKMQPQGIVTDGGRAWWRSDEFMYGVELAHIFDTGWSIGKICGKKTSRGTWPVLYPGSSTQWLHKLDIEMYGEDKFWVIVERTSGSPPPHQPPLVHAMGIEQLHDRAKTLQKQIDHAEAQQRERQKERENARDRDRGRGGSSSSGEAEEEAEAEEEEAQSADTSADEMARQRNRKRLRRHEHR